VPSIAILGAGLAGLAAANRLGQLGLDVTIFEKTASCGGHARSIHYDGFTFDEGPHVSFTKDLRVQQLFARGAGAVLNFPLNLANAVDGRFITHPVQCHLAGLPHEFIASCIADIAHERSMNRRSIRDYEQWCIAAFGRTFAETFTFPYTRKYWTVEPCCLTTDWVGSRMYPPRLLDVVRGALGRQEGAFHYISDIRYPARGGFQSFIGGMLDVPIATNCEAIAVQPKKRTIEFQNGTSVHYDVLISTLPLPVLAGLIEPPFVPRSITHAAARLLCTSVVLVDLAVSGLVVPDTHIVYVHDERRVSSRIHFPSRLARANAPEGCECVQVEVYYTAAKPIRISRDHLAERVVEELVDLHIIGSRDDVRFVRVRDIPFANVVFTAPRAAAVCTVRRWLETLHIEVAGRYGEWDYFWTDDSVRSGWRAADAVIRWLHDDV
jgi:protoporphyrinogen oxidase